MAARHYVTTGDIAAWDQTLATLRITSKLWYRYVYFGMGPNTASHHIINYDKVAGRHYVIIGDIATKHW